MQDLFTVSNIAYKFEMVPTATFAEPFAESTSPVFGGWAAFAYPGLRTTALRTDFVFALLALLRPAFV